ncbi:hypothetical protein GJ496_005735 [Pomphorhynchus laevis]|nr:hypothetical protein GJ496_005735 [Pomphorhynchus laevis]
MLSHGDLINNGQSATSASSCLGRIKQMTAKISAKLLSAIKTYAENGDDILVDKLQNVNCLVLDRQNLDKVCKLECPCYFQVYILYFRL